MIRSGRSSAQAITRARILLKIDEGWTAPQVIGKGRVSYAIGKAGKGPRLPCKRRRQSASHGRLDSTPAPTGESELRPAALLVRPVLQLSKSEPPMSAFEMVPFDRNGEQNSISPPLDIKEAVFQR